MATEAFGEWCILELFGHRRLGGYVTEQEIGGVSFIRIEVPRGCTGVAADWCPVCGDCTCPDRERHIPEQSCHLHGTTSTHDEGYQATQFYNPSAVYAITPTSEATAKAFAANNQPEPITQWDIRLPTLGPPTPAAVWDDPRENPDLSDYEY